MQRKRHEEASLALTDLTIRESFTRMLSWGMLVAATLGLLFDWWIFRSFNAAYFLVVMIALMLIGYRTGHHLTLGETVLTRGSTVGQREIATPSLGLVLGIAVVGIGLSALLTSVFWSSPQLFLILTASGIAALLFTVGRRRSLHWALVAVALLQVYLVTATVAFPAASGYAAERLLAFILSATLAVATLFVVGAQKRDRDNLVASRFSLVGAAVSYLLAWISLAEAPLAAAWQVGFGSLVVILLFLAAYAWAVSRPHAASRFIILLASATAILYAYLFWDTVTITLVWLVAGITLLVAGVIYQSKLGRMAALASLLMGYVSYMVLVLPMPSYYSVIWWQLPGLWLGLFALFCFGVGYVVYLQAKRTGVEARLQPAIQRAVVVLLGSVLVGIWLTYTTGFVLALGLYGVATVAAIAGWRHERVSYLAPAALLFVMAAVQTVALTGVRPEEARLLAFLALAILVILTISFIHAESTRNE